MFQCRSDSAAIRHVQAATQNCNSPTKGEREVRKWEDPDCSSLICRRLPQYHGGYSQQRV
ncbi:unnamed protein product [Ectocarpus sp. CCAP 1310/34]|nr:unnamed protein product [Ectocarpus sp. CCAP 1310/34]